MRNRFYSLGPVEQLADDEVIGIAITSDVGRDGDIWIPSGIDLTNYRANPVVLRQHDPDCVVGSAVEIGLVDPDTIGIRIRFAPAGASADADETRALCKAGVLRGISAGIDPTRTEPLDPSQPYGAWRVLEAELLEVSLVSIPADANAMITQRSYSPRSMSLTAIDDRSIQRMLRLASEPRSTPPALRTPREHFEEQRQRTMTAWAAGLASADADRAQRDAQRAALERSARELGIDEPRRRRKRNRPYGL